GILALTVGARLVAHRAARIEHEITAQVGLVLEPLHVVAVRSCVEPPVEVARIVAGTVLAVLAELDREARIRAAVNALDEPLHGDPRADLEALDPHQRFGIDERRPGPCRVVPARVESGGCGALGGGHQSRGPFTCSSRRSMTASTV